MSVDAETVLNFWFGDERGDPDELRQRFQRWFQVDPEFDGEIRRHFESAVIAASRGELNELAKSAIGRLALILLLDQFPRNIFRGSEKAFAFDALALELCDDGILHQFDTQLRPIERVFFYMPLEHNEDLAIQQMSVAKFEDLVTTAPGTFVEFAKTNLKFAQEHLALIERFGRFPHRNQVLGRVSTPAELAFLATQSTAFGQG